MNETPTKTEKEIFTKEDFLNGIPFRVKNSLDGVLKYEPKDETGSYPCLSTNDGHYVCLIRHVNTKGFHFTKSFLGALLVGNIRFDLLIKA